MHSSLGILGTVDVALASLRDGLAASERRRARRRLPPPCAQSISYKTNKLRNARTRLCSQEYQTGASTLACEPRSSSRRHEYDSTNMCSREKKRPYRTRLFILLQELLDWQVLPIMDVVARLHVASKVHNDALDQLDLAYTRGQLLVFVTNKPMNVPQSRHCKIICGCQSSNGPFSLATCSNRLSS